VLVAGGTLIAAWCGGDLSTTSLVEPILGVTMLICGVGSTATAVNRWVVAYRELARRYEAEAGAKAEPIAPPVAPIAPATARVMLPAHVRKVSPLEQH
jgi:hypothetical protein